MGNDRACTVFLKSIVTVLVALCAMLILSAIKVVELSIVAPAVEPGLSA
jgi:hypothetical protein